MRRPVWLLLAALAAACGPRPATLASYRQPAEGFTVSHPSGWTVDDADPRAVRIAPPGGGGADFILVLTRPVDRPPDDDEVRSMTLREVGAYGVSKFQRDPRSTGGVVWHRFEVTGASGNGQWASIGAVVVGPRKMRTVVCAGSFEAWRTQLRLCDRIVSGFDPGSLD